MKVNAQTVDELLKQAQFRESFKAMPQGDTFKDLSTICIIPIPGPKTDKKFLNCKKCKTKNDYESWQFSGLHPMFVEAYKRLVRPMNVPFLEMMPSGYEVGDAYNKAIEMILATPALNSFKFILTVEYDNIVPFIPNTQGPLMMLYETMEKGFDAVGGLYWTKGTPSMPLIYGDPKEGRKEPAGMFKVIFPSRKPKPSNWKPGQIVSGEWHDGDIIECNGTGMGFTLFKLDLFRDTRFKKPWFKTLNDHSKKGSRMYTQDLYFFEKFRNLGYKCAIDSRVKLGHLDFQSGIIY